MIKVRVEFLIEPDQYDDWRRSPELFGRSPQLFAGLVVADLLGELPTSDTPEARITESVYVDAQAIAIWRAGDVVTTLGAEPYDDVADDASGPVCADCGLANGYHTASCPVLAR